MSYIASLSSRSRIQEELSALDEQESTLNSTLATLIQANDQLSTKLATLAATGPLVTELNNKSLAIANEIATVSTTAGRVATKVRKLDDEQSKVNHAIRVVQEVQDLKNSIGLLDIAIEKQDWETATRYLQRTSTIDPKVVESGFAEAVVVRFQLLLRLSSKYQCS